MPLIPPAGVSPLSANEVTPVQQPKSPPVILADSIGDSSSDTPGDFMSLTRSADPIDDSVRQMMMLKRNSGAVARNKGQRYESIRHIDELSNETAMGITEEALKALVSQGYLEIMNVSSETDNDTGLVDVTFRNLVTGKNFTRKVSR